MVLTGKNQGIGRAVYLPGGCKAFSPLLKPPTFLGLWPLPSPSKPALQIMKGNCPISRSLISKFNSIWNLHFLLSCSCVFMSSENKDIYVLGVTLLPCPTGCLNECNGGKVVLSGSWGTREGVSPEGNGSSWGPLSWVSVSRPQARSTGQYSLLWVEGLGWGV